MVTIAVCIITCRRPADLARTLASVAELTVPENTECRVVVVDNDSEGSAKSVVDSFATDAMPCVVYAIEPKPGIPFARNRCVRLAEDCDFLAFVDDDETVLPGWISELLAVQRQYDADVVTGPVVREFPTTVPAWIRERFLGPRYPTGRRPTPWFGTGNVLFRTRVLEAVPGPFDERLALSGGSDSMLAMELTRRGIAIYWADDALVTEYVPSSRLSWSWLIRRSFRCGMMSATCERLYRDRRLLVRRVVVAGGGCLVGVLTVFCGLVRGRGTVLAGICRSARGVGGYAGLLGHRYEEYRHLHTD